MQGDRLVFIADSAVAGIVTYVSIYARPVHCLSCLCLHLVYPLMCSMQASKGVMEEFWGNTGLGTLEEEISFNRQFIPGSPEVPGDLQDLLPALWPTPKG